MLTGIDNIVILACVVGIFGIGKHFSKTSTDMDSFYKANKSLPWALVVGTLMASWYGGAGVVGTVGYATTMGFAGFFIWSIGAHAVRFPLALWVAPRISVKVNSTMPDLLNSAYGRFAAVFGAIVIVISCLSIGEIGATGYVGVAAWGANKFVVAAIVVIISIVISSLGGLMGVAVTDMIFFFLMVTSVSAVFPKVFYTAGGLNGIEQSLNSVAPEMLTPFGGIPLGRAITLILLCINLYKDPAFYQRFAAANSPTTGKRAMLTCFSIWLSFDLVLVMTGTIVRTLDPLMAVQPEVGYISLILENLPVVFRGLFVVGIMGAIISTIDSYFLIGGEIMANDIIGAIRKTPLSDKSSIRITRISCVIFGAIGLFAAFQFTLVYDAFLFVSSLSMCVLFVPVLVAIMYGGKKTNVAGIASMIAGGLVWVVCTYIYPVSIDFLGGVVDAVLIGLPASFIAFIIGNNFGIDLTAIENKKMLKY